MHVFLLIIIIFISVLLPKCYNIFFPPPPIFSCVEVPIIPHKTGVWGRLADLNLEYEDVSDNKSTTASRLLWQRRLLLTHDDAGRLLELHCSQGFYVTTDDYILPGN